MAAFLYPTGEARWRDEYHRPFHWLLTNNLYVPDKTHEFVLGCVDIYELSVGGYTPGHASSSRLPARMRTEGRVPPENVAVVFFDDLIWPALQPAQTIGNLILFEIGSNDDSDAALIACFPLTEVQTDGSNIEIRFDPTNGNVRVQL